MLSLVRQFSFVLVSLFIINQSSFADMGIFRLKGKVFYNSDTLEMKKKLLDLKKCLPTKPYIESYLGMDINRAVDDKNSRYIANLVSYKKLHHHSVINSTLKIEGAAKDLFKKCFSDFSNEAMALSLSEYYLQRVVRDISKFSEIRSDLDKTYDHDLLSSKSSPSVWKKK